MDFQEIAKQLQEKYGHPTASSKSEEETYRCEKCHDTLWIAERDEHGRNIYYPCECYHKVMAEQKLMRSGLADVVHQQTFDSFETNTETQQRMKDIAQDYVRSLLENPNNPRRPWMYIGGNPGSGKTHICTAACGELLKNNIGVRYMQWLNEAPRLKVCAYDEHFEEYVAEFINPSVLYIDDLLKQKYTDDPKFTEADIKVAFTILNARYLMNKPTIISSEWDLIDQLLSADEGVFSRVYERCKGFTMNVDRKPENNYRLRKGDT